MAGIPAPALMRIFLRGGQCSADLCRMMCIIVNDGDTVYGSFVLETAVGTVESVQTSDDGICVDSHGTGKGDGAMAFPACVVRERQV